MIKYLSLATVKGDIVINNQGFYVFDGRPTKQKWNDNWLSDYPHLSGHNYIDVSVPSIDPMFVENGIPYHEEYYSDGVAIILYCDLGTPQKEIKKAMAQLRNDRDIVMLKVVKVKPFKD